MKLLIRDCLNIIFIETTIFLVSHIISLAEIKVEWKEVSNYDLYQFEKNYFQLRLV